VFLSLDMYGQDRLINPTSTFLELNNDIPTYKCDTFDIDQMVEMSKNDLLNGVSPLRFAKKFAVSLTPDNSGVWEEQEGLMIWRLRIESEKAFSMMLIIDDLNLPTNSSLFFYNQDMLYTVGPYTELYTESKVLPTPLVPGSAIIVELVYEKDSLETSPPSFVISSISHDYANMFGYLNQIKEDEFASSILDCHNDINCNVGNPWQIEKQAVARIVIDGEGLCTGGLINNTLSDRTPYFLTADHCIDNNNEANTSVFYFNYESPVCDGGDGQTNHIVSGAQRRAFNWHSDFSLLQLNARVPTSYQPFYAGWDRGGANPNNAVVIHHPAGNVKKISFDNDPIIPNVDAIIFGPVNLQPNTAWDVDLDDGTTEGGSSGAPLFNNDGRIIGQNSGGHRGCPGNNGVIKYYGRLSVSWNTGTNNTERLRDWLDPDNNAPNEILGFAPQGWLHNWVIAWDAPSDQNVHSSIKALSVGEGNQVFYRGTDNKMHTLFWSSGSWNHDWVNGSNAPSNENIAGDVVAGEGNQLFYRGSDGKMHVYYWSNNDWHHDWLGGWNAPSAHNVKSTSGSIAVGVGNQVYYRGNDNKMQVYYFSNGSWQHGWLGGSNAPSAHNVSGDIVAGENGQVFYRGSDGKMQVYYFSNGSWQHGWLGGWNAPSAHDVKSTAGSISVGAGNQVYYRGNDNKMQVYYGSNGSWNHDWLGGWDAPSAHNISGDIAAGENGQVFYRGPDGKMHVYYWADSGWAHDWIEASWQAPSAHNVAGAIGVGTSNQTFYRGTDGRCRVYFWEQGFFRSSLSDHNYTMYETRPSPTIPGSVSAKVFDIVTYPNPVQGELKIRVFAKEAGIFNVSLFDVTGRLLMIGEMNDSMEKVLSFQDIPSGIFILKIRDSIGNVVTEKIVKQ